MAQIMEIDVVGAGELLTSETGSPRSPGESVQMWSMMELVGAAAVAVSTEPGMLAAAPATAMAVLEHARVTADANAQIAEAAVLQPVSIVAAVPPVPNVAAPSAAPQRNSTVDAARRRVRGPTLTEKRLREAADAEKAEEKRREQHRASKKRKPLDAPVATATTGYVATSTTATSEDAASQAKHQRRGRARVHAMAQKTSVDEPAGSEAAAVHGQLETKAETRRSKVVRGLGAAGAANLSNAPSPEGLEGADAFDELMFDFVDDNMHGRAVQVRHLDRRDLELGLFGDFLEQRGHGKFVEWVYDDESEGWKIQAVEEERGVRIPRASMVMDYVIQVRGALPSSDCRVCASFGC